jgi:flagellar biosynthesis/type III secretory pathway ATPase
MARNPDLYRRQFEMTPKGIMVTETSDDPDMVAVIREHAREVTEFVETGMPGMMHGRMRSR